MCSVDSLFQPQNIEFIVVLLESGSVETVRTRTGEFECEIIRAPTGETLYNMHERMFVLAHGAVFVANSCRRILDPS